MLQYNASYESPSSSMRVDCASLSELQFGFESEFVRDGSRCNSVVESDIISNSEPAVTLPPALPVSAVHAQMPARRHHPYRRSPSAQSAGMSGLDNTLPRKAPYRIRKAHVRRSLICCDICNHRRLPDVSPYTVKWHRNVQPSTQGAQNRSHSLYHIIQAWFAFALQTASQCATCA